MYINTNIYLKLKKTNIINNTNSTKYKNKYFT